MSEEIKDVHVPNSVDVDLEQLKQLGMLGGSVKDMKFDDGKVMAALPFEDFPHAIHAVARVGTFGAKKYARHSWKTVNDAFTRYQDAAYRHRLAIHMGEVTDSESGLPHRAHLVWNELVLLQLELSK